MGFPKKIQDWNKHPWDKISHLLIALLITIVGLLIGFGYEATAAASGLFYGREQAQEERFQQDYIDPWFFWTWRKDGVFDWIVPMVGAFAFVHFVGEKIPNLLG